MAASFFRLEQKTNKAVVRPQCSTSAERRGISKRKRVTLGFSWDSPRIFLLSLGAAAAPRKNCEGCQALRDTSLRHAASSPDAMAAPVHLGVSIAHSIDAPR